MKCTHLHKDAPENAICEDCYCECGNRIKQYAEVDDISARLDNVPQRHCHNKTTIEEGNVLDFLTWDEYYRNIYRRIPHSAEYKLEVTKYLADKNIFCSNFVSNCTAIIEKEVCEIR